MNLYEFKLELERDMVLMTDQELSDIFGSARRKDFPKIRAMRRRLIAESVLIVFCTMAAALMTVMVYGGRPVAVFFIGFAVVFVALEMLGFHYFWELPQEANLKESLEQDLHRMQRVTMAIKMLNLCLGFILLAIVLIDSNLTNQVPLSAVVTMFAVKIMAWLFSMKWIARERQMKLALKELNDDES